MSQNQTIDQQSQPPKPIDPVFQMQVRAIEAGCLDIDDLVRSMPDPPTHEHLPGDLRQLIDSLRTKKAALHKRSGNISGPVLEACSQLRRGTGDASEVVAAGAAAKKERLELLEEAISVADQCRDLADAAYEPLREIAEDEKANLADTVEEIKTRLTKALIGAETTIAGRQLGAESAEAQRQFMVDVRRTLDYGPANQKAVEADSRAKSTKDVVRRAADCGQQLRSRLTALVAKDLAV